MDVAKQSMDSQGQQSGADGWLRKAPAEKNLGGVRLGAMKEVRSNGTTFRNCKRHDGSARPWALPHQRKQGTVRGCYEATSRLRRSFMGVFFQVECAGAGDR